MDYILSGREPADALRYFEEIAAIPHGSYNEKVISLYLMDFAKEHDLWAYRDSKKNVYIKKPASKGYEHLPAVLLQGHMDMVCEKNADTVHDFDVDGLKLYVENDMLHARGTTLGADDAVAMVYMMAILARTDLVHPPIECLFTTEEEVGLGGANHVDPSHFSAKYMINIDAGPEGSALVSCAGGAITRVDKPTEWEVAVGRYITIKVRGLLGGHSGTEIGKEHGNSNKIMGRILHHITKDVGMHLIHIEGGSKDNAIPRECDALIAVPAEKFGDAAQIIKTLTGIIQSELAGSDPGFTVLYEEYHGTPEKMLTQKCSEEFVTMLYLMPNGVRNRSIVLDDFVVCSLNVGVVKTDEKRLSITAFTRSAVDTLTQNTYEEVHTLAKAFGATAVNLSEYPGWQMQEVSPFRELCCEVYKELFHTDLKVEAVHAGLECGILKDKLPDLDIIAIGPTFTGAHTPDETLDLQSFARTFDFVLGILKAMCK